MALGFKNKKFVPFKGKKSTGISATALKDRGQTLVMSVAIAHEKSLDVLFDTAKVYSIAENYANGGLPYLLNMIAEKDNIGSPVVRMENELRQEINKIILKRSQSVEHAPDEVVKSPYEKIEDLESGLRKLISQKLEEVSKNWLKERLPTGILQEWKIRESDRSDKQLLKPNKIQLINYSHVGELKDIIIKRDNWKDKFKSVFKDEKFLESQINLLIPIRNKVMHGNVQDLSQLEIKSLDLTYDLFMDLIKPEIG